MNRSLAMQLLLECRGDEVWSPELCLERGIPEEWITELADSHESGFRFRAQELWTDEGLVNQYHGVADVRLAARLARELGIHVDQIAVLALSPRDLVRRLQAELDEVE